MELFTDNSMRGLLENSLKTVANDENGWRNVTEAGGSDEVNYIAFLKISNLTDSVPEDV